MSGGITRAHLAIAVVLTAIVLGVGVVLGATVFGDRGPAESPSPQPLRDAAPADAPAPALAAPGDASLAARVAALEKALADLRSHEAAAVERVRPLVEEYEKMKASGAMLEAPGPEIPLGTEDSPGAMDVRKLAKKLGLAAPRSEAMATELAQVMSEIEALEASHAQVSREGDVTTIRISKYSDQAARTVQRWKDWVDHNLTPPEKEAYEREHGESQLLGVRTGMFDRTVKIDESSGAIRVTESIQTADGPQDVFEMQAPASARDFALEGWKHLLPGAPDR